MSRGIFGAVVRHMVCVCGACAACACTLCRTPRVCLSVFGTVAFFCHEAGHSEHHYGGGRNHCRVAQRSVGGCCRNQQNHPRQYERYSVEAACRLPHRPCGCLELLRKRVVAWKNSHNDVSFRCFGGKDIQVAASRATFSGKQC